MSSPVQKLSILHSLARSLIGLALALLVAPASHAHADAPRPYTAQVAASTRARAAAELRAASQPRQAFVPIPDQRWQIGVREARGLNFLFNRKRARSWDVYGIDSGVVRTIPLGETIQLRGSMRYRFKGKMLQRPATATVSQESPTSGATTRLRFSLPRRSGGASYYTVTFSEHRPAKLLRVPASAAADRTCGNITEALTTQSAHAAVDSYFKQKALSARVAGIVPPAQPGVTFREVKIAMIADYDYFTASGSNQTTTSNKIASLMNDVSAIFERDLGVTITLSTIYIHTSASDPYTSDDAEVLLTQIENSVSLYGNADIYHLLTARNIYGTIGGAPNYSVIGLAYLAQVCTTSGYPYSLTEKFQDSLDYITIAHELGHNFGANHDQFHTSPSTIMFPALPVSQVKFSTFSQGEILTNYLTNGFYNYYPGADNTVPTPIPMQLRSGCLPTTTRDATPTPPPAPTATATPTATPAPVLPSLSLSGTITSRGIAQFVVTAPGASDATCQHYLDIAPDTRFRISTRTSIELGDGDISQFTLSGRITRRALIPRGRSSSKAYARARYVCDYGTATSRTISLRADQVRARQSVTLSTWISQLARSIS